MTATKSVKITVNGNPYELDVGSKPGQITPSHTLLYTLRETLGLTGTKVSCSQGVCGVCTVIMDSKAVPSCRVLTIECDGKNITTIEGLRDPKTGVLDPLQQAFVDYTAFQCGFCTPGMIMTSKALLNKNPHPTEDQAVKANPDKLEKAIAVTIPYSVGIAVPKDKPKFREAATAAMNSDLQVGRPGSTSEEVGPRSRQPEGTGPAHGQVMALFLHYLSLPYLLEGILRSPCR